MPHVALKLHRRRRQRVVLGEGERGGEDAALERRVSGALQQALPREQVVLVARACHDAVGALLGQVAVLGQQPLVRRGCHLFPPFLLLLFFLNILFLSNSGFCDSFLSGKQKENKRIFFSFLA